MHLTGHTSADGSSIRFSGDLHHHACSSLRRKLGPNGSAMPGDDLLGDMEAQPHPRAVIVGVRPVKPFEEMGTMFGWHTHTLVQDREPHCPRRAFGQLDLDPSTIW